MKRPLTILDVPQDPLYRTNVKKDDINAFFKILHECGGNEKYTAVRKLHERQTSGLDETIPVYFSLPKTINIQDFNRKFCGSK